MGNEYCTDPTVSTERPNEYAIELESQLKNANNKITVLESKYNEKIKIITELQSKLQNERNNETNNETEQNKIYQIMN